MRTSTITVSTTFILALANLSAQQPTSNNGKPTVEESAPPSASDAVVTGHPFSAIKYARRVKELPNGKQRILSNEQFPVQLARDAQGRIYMQDIGPLGDPDCNLPQPPEPEVCPVWSAFVFDPLTQTITHWPEGERAAHSAVVLKLSAAQVEDAENSTSAMPANELDWDTTGAIITKQDLGEKDIEGIQAAGVRTTNTIPAGHFGNKQPIVTIHEVWISQEMNLVVKIIDGDPQNEETISGLEHVSLQPDPALFQPPDGYGIQHRTSVGEYVDNDMTDLAGWFVTPSPSASQN